MKQEDEHFSLFNYIQTVNQETDQHVEKTEELEVRQYRSNTAIAREQRRNGKSSSENHYLGGTAFSKCCLSCYYPRKFETAARK